MIPFVVAFFYTFILFYNLWLPLITGILAMIYSYAYIIPQQVKRGYENNAFREKNNFVNNMTQILTNNEKTVLQALKTVADRANGEFKEDLLKLQAKIVDGSNQDIQDSFQWLANKYESDVIFSLYVEQLTTLVIEGRHNIETLKDIKTYHNEIKKRQEKFFIQKQQKEWEFKFMCKVVLFVSVPLRINPVQSKRHDCQNIRLDRLRWPGCVYLAACHVFYIIPISYIIIISSGICW